MSGTMSWTNMYAAETGTGAYYSGMGTAYNADWAAKNGGGAEYWDMDWSWGSEAIPLEYAGFMVSVTDLDEGEFRVTMTPGPVPVPAAVWLLGSGLIGLAGLRRKFNN